MTDLVEKYIPKGVLLDTNLLVLLIIGLVDREKIPSHKRTNKYTPDDFDLLIHLLDRFQKIVVTPHILAETSNLIDTFTGQMKALPFQRLKTVVERVTVVEIHFSAIEACQLSGFERFGLSDAALVEVAREKYLILTDDFNLMGFALSQSVDVINFNHIRDMVWQQD